MLVCFNLGETFWYALIWQIGRRIFKYCQVCWKVLIFFLCFVGFLLQTFDVFRLRAPNWGFLSDAGMFHFGRGLLVRFNLVDWETHFSVLQGLLKCFIIFFRFCWVSFADFWFFPVVGANLGIFEWCWYVSLWAGSFGTLQSGRLWDPFFSTAGFVQMFYYFSRFCWVSFADFWFFPVVGANLGTFEWCWYVSLWAGCFGMLQSGRLEDPFFNTAGFARMFYYFFWILLGLFLQTFYVFQLLGPIWGFLSNVGMFDFGWGLLVHLHLIDWSCFNFSTMAICVFSYHKMWKYKF